MGVDLDLDGEYLPIAKARILEALAQAGKVRAEDLPLVLPPKDGAFLKDRFRGALLGPGAVG